MADDKVPGSKPPDANAVTGSLPAGTGEHAAPSELVAPNVIGVLPPDAASQGAVDSMWPVKAIWGEVEQALCWMIGAAILFSVWVIPFTVHSFTNNRFIAGFVWLLLLPPIAFLETRQFWLSHMLRLRVKPTSNPWLSGFFLWLLGPISLFLRSSAEPQTATTESEPQMVADANPAREVVETIVFVVVLVLLLKSFIAEAFVIPTGSMAETLYGYQKVVTCPSCGHTFPVNCSNEVDPQEPPPVPVTGCTCPNCRQAIRMIPEDGRRNRRLKEESMPARAGAFPFEDYPGMDGKEYREIVDPGWNSGDRVLVGKFLYELGSPHPLDVVVFKYPAGPQKNHVPMNYIKRLIGMPEQTVAIYRGNVYYLPKEKHTWTYYDPALAEDDSKIPEVDLWNPGMPNPHDPRHPNDERALTAFSNGQFQILRKTPAVILAMRRIVYDNEHQPSDLLAKEWQRWASDTEAWSTGDSREFRHGAQATTGDKINWLNYRHLLRGKTPQPTLITDFMGYNHEDYDVWDPIRRTWAPNPRESKDRVPKDGNNWVGDLSLDAEVEVDKPEGAVIFQLARGVDRFRLTWDLDTGMMTLSRLSSELQEEKLEQKQTKAKKGTYQIRFANVDERLTVWVDDDLVFGDGVTFTPPKDQGPKTNDLEPAKIGVRGAAGIAVRKLKLWRDTYYTAKERDPSDSGEHTMDWSNPSKWEKMGNNGTMPRSTYYVQKGHYLCMGDNSPASSDSRTWGLVPQRLMLGRALLVYWPKDRAGRIR